MRVKVEGLKELHSALGRADRRMSRAVNAAIKDAAQIIVKDAKRRVPSGPPARGHARASIRPRVRGKRGEIRGGGARYPYYGWLEFGGHVGRNNSVARRRVKSGRYLYPAVKATRPRFMRAAKRQVNRTLRGSGLRVRGL